MDNNTFKTVSPSPWHGEEPDSYELINDPEALKADLKPKMGKVKNVLLSIPIILFHIYALIPSPVVGIGYLFYNGLIFEKIFSEHSWLFLIHLGIFLLDVIIISCWIKYPDKFYLFQRKPSIKDKITDKFPEYKFKPAYGFIRLRFNKPEAYKFLIPSSSMLMNKFTPSQWKKYGFKDKNGHIEFSWDNEKLIKYESKSGQLVSKIKVANYFNYIFIFLAIPAMVWQMTNEEVNQLVYYFLFFCSALLFLARHFTKKKPLEMYEAYIFNRKTGLVTYNSETETHWCCAFKDLCPQIEMVIQQNQSSSKVTLVPKKPIGKLRQVLTIYGLDSHITTKMGPYMWLVIQAFMNIDSPLPHAIVLEENRDKDPASFKYRNPDGPKFLTMTDSDYKKIIDNELQELIRR